jgi:hypothetical protein
MANLPSNLSPDLVLDGVDAQVMPFGVWRSRFPFAFGGSASNAISPIYSQGL